MKLQARDKTSRMDFAGPTTTLFSISFSRVQIVARESKTTIMSNMIKHSDPVLTTFGIIPPYIPPAIIVNVIMKALTIHTKSCCLNLTSGYLCAIWINTVLTAQYLEQNTQKPP